MKKALVTVACLAMVAMMIDVTGIKANAAQSVPATYYVLNRELSVPQEPCVGTYPKSNYSAGISGSISVSYSAPEGAGTTANVKGLIVNSPSKEQLASIGINLADYEGITWYVIKTEDDGVHVDGVISDQRVTITVRYGYLNANGAFVELAPSVVKTYNLGESYSITSPVVAGYATTLKTVAGTASSSMSYDVLYTTEATQEVIVNYYRSSISGTLLGTTTIQVGESQLAEFYNTITTSWLNLYKPTDCYAGTLASYTQNEDGVWVANVVYAPIPVKPVNTNPSAPNGGNESYTNGGAVVTELDTPVRPGVVIRNLSTIPTRNDVNEVSEVSEEASEEASTETIVDEKVPQNAAPVIDESDAEIEVNMIDGNTVEIDDEEAPLGHGRCIGHWIILIATVIYTIFAFVRISKRNRKINNMAETRPSMEA